jgi:hypothetical protein
MSGWKIPPIGTLCCLLYKNLKEVIRLRRAAFGRGSGARALTRPFLWGDVGEH